MLVSMECKKQKKISVSLSRAMTKALGKEGSFAEGRPIALGKVFLKKIKFLQHFFAEGHGWRPSAKTFFKKNKISLPRACVEALGKDFSKKKNNSLPRAVPLPSAKIFLKKIKFLQHFFAEGHGWRPSAKTF